MLRKTSRGTTRKQNSEAYPMLEDRMLPGQTEKNRFFFATACGLILIPINAYWIALVSGMRGSLHPAYASLINCTCGQLILSRLIEPIVEADFPSVCFEPD
ncbi:TPA: hypothetical protein EYN98_19855 [Candidatus Poribacteria bacterium]|nr:hypothetical protein [Candidatus Poribacteria bacterium]HIA68258.1 hypothetical protein [Candidatus Poribacteria bacterium]HIB86658.1 hypothetical protein [Candidatus Poribacteria bacterium]HIN30877.1 hypothetical protein [Candidatus Poribacteria bacterium]